MKERLNKAVSELTAILEEMQHEVEEYRAKKAKWYNEQLTQSESGLVSNDDFNKETLDRYMQLYSDFDYRSEIEQIENLEKSLEFLNENKSMLDEFVSEAKNRVPDGWKLWSVTFNDSDFGCVDSADIYGPNEEYAKNRVLAIQKHDYNEVTVIKVEEVQR